MNDKTILLKSISWASYTGETAYEMLKSESFNVKVLPFEKKVVHLQLLSSLCAYLSDFNRSEQAANAELKAEKPKTFLAISGLWVG